MDRRFPMAPMALRKPPEGHVTARLDRQAYRPRQFRRVPTAVDVRNRRYTGWPMLTSADGLTDEIENPGNRRHDSA